MAEVSTCAVFSYISFVLIRTKKIQNLLGLIEKEINDVISAFRMVEENEERPVNEPCSLLKRLEWRTDRLKNIKESC